MEQEKGSDRFKQATKVTLIGSVANLFLSILKIFLGVIGRSSAMIADGIHSFSDLATDIAVIFGMKASTKPSDSGHRYGHGKIETLITMLIALILLGVGIGISLSAISSMMEVINGKELEIPRPVALIGAIVSILIKEALYWYTRKTGESIGSKAMIANAWHHRTDSFSSVATLLGIGGAILLGGRWAVLDPLAALIVTLLIFWVSFKILKDCLNELVEGSLDEKTELELIDIIKGVRGVQDPHNLRTRKIGDRIAVDVHIKVDSGLSVGSAHRIVENVERKVKDRFGGPTLINVHMDPDDI